MLGLTIPFVDQIVEKVSKIAVDAVFRGLNYMFCYQAFVNDLNSEIEKLNIEEDNMSREVETEKKRGKIIKDAVLKWQNDVEEIQESDDEVSPSCSCIPRLPIPDPISRLYIGRNALKKAQTVSELTIFRKEHLSGGIAYFPEFINMPKSDTTYEEFQSRKDLYKKLWDALKDEESPLIHGIYGMAGVGKTRMMEQVWENAVKEKIFKRAVRVNVGRENQDIIKLQEQIAGLLDCKLAPGVMERRAFQLETSLKNGNKILLILDDVWRDIHLDSIIGTPYDDGSSSSRGSKILFTSREREVCENNNCKNFIEIQTLSPKEALYLFEKTVGPADSDNPLPDKSLVEEVCDKCGELPLLIHAVGKALKGKSYKMWENARDLLKEGKFEGIAGVNPKVYSAIKLSIDFLQNDDAKSCLFLCSMFPEDANIDMKMLIQLATGSQLIRGGESRVLAVVDYLKISSLLLNSGKDNVTKVHDVIRSVARWEAFRDSKYSFLQVTCNSRYLPSDASYSYHTRRFLRLDAETDDVHFKEHVVCPEMHTLWLQSNKHPQQFSGGFFSMFANISCLMLQKVNISMEQFSLQPLGNLGTLSLLECDISNTDARLFPKSLETLCICKCELPVPLDVANLKYLRMLEIQQWKPQLVMVSNVISSLPSLEELHIPNGFIVEHEEYHTQARVSEISKLTHLRSLQFQFYCDDTFQGTKVLSNINKYNIYVGAPEQFDPQVRNRRYPSTRLIEFYGNQSQPWEGLIARAKVLRFNDSEVELSSIYNGHERAFEDLKRLHINDCNKMGHLASISQDEIQPATCFSKLTNLSIIDCSALKYLFCKNIAKNLVHLQELSVDFGDSMEAIIMNDGTGDGEIINFSKLKSLTLSDMPRFVSFYAEASMDNSANPSVQYQPLFDGTVAFPSMETLDITNLPNTSVIWGSGCFNDPLFSFCKLKNLCVYDCEKLEILVPEGMLHKLEKLERVYTR